MRFSIKRGIFSLTNLKNIYKKYIVPLIQFIFLLAAIIGIYQFISVDQAIVSYRIVANSNVIDLNEDLSKLEILYDSVNLKNSNQKLRIISIKIENTGKKSLTLNDYDNSDPIGIKLNRGKIIEKPEIIEASSGYLDKTLSIRFHNDSIIELSPVIMDVGDYFIVKFLTLHKFDLLPLIESIGKIAGQKQISILEDNIVQDDTSFIEKLFGGPILIQVLRFVIILFFMAIFFALLGTFNAKKYDSRLEKRRELTVRKYIDQNEYIKENDDIIFDIYMKYGGYCFIIISVFIKHEEMLNSLFEFKEKPEEIPDDLRSRGNLMEKAFVNDVNWFLLAELKEKKYIHENEKGVWYFDDNFKRRFMGFVNFLNENSELDMNDGFI